MDVLREPPDAVGATRLRVLGRFAVKTEGHAFEVPVAGQRVLALLAVQGGSADRHRLAGTVWPDRPGGPGRREPPERHLAAPRAPAGRHRQGGVIAFD